ncbi:divalent-cation tolerance protein CutA [Candidatus Micrarchaeota archaeon]|nr:divalent-cation tolerance protein CutA [Candidatus Micrarchaeota archaeon]
MILVLSAYPDLKSAESMALKLVQKELAACVNIVKSENSVYRWKGKIEMHSEYLLFIKTLPKAYPQLELMIKEGHPYSTPEIIVLEVKGGNTDYVSWIDSTVLSRLLSVPLDFRAIKREGVPERESTSAKKPNTLSR